MKAFETLSFSRGAGFFHKGLVVTRSVFTEEMGGNVDEEKELALRKYAELYEHSKAVLAEELARSHRADEKASKYLTALSLVLGALVFFFQRAMREFG